MLLYCLIAFGLAGIAFNSLGSKRSLIALLLSAGSIAIISPVSLLACALLALINYLFLQFVAKKKIVLVFAVIFNIVALAAFHLYENLPKETFYAKLPALLGVSFLVLQFIDYQCKVYFDQVQKPKNFLSYISGALYLPKFFSGPIASLPSVERDLISVENKPNPAAYGINRILLGLFKKLVLAESLAPIVHSVFDFKDAYPGLTLLTGAFLYALQLYFDFAGYTDMAIGVSALWRTDLPENFNFPFRQKSWSAFWKSWHSSLTNWLWQYVFNPLFLFFTRRKINKVFALLVCSLTVFACMAFFNGLRTGFFISAFIFAFFYLVELLFSTKKSFLSGSLIFIFFSIGLIYFRSMEYTEYALITDRLFDTENFLPGEWLRGFFAPLASGGTQQDYFNLTVTLSLSLAFLLFERKIFSIFSQNKINPYACFLLLILLFTWGVFTNGERFIYMQF